MGHFAFSNFIFQNIFNVKKIIYINVIIYYINISMGDKEEIFPKCYKGGVIITETGDGTTINSQSLCEDEPPGGGGGLWDSSGKETICDINLINRYKEAEEENMLAYQRIIESGGSEDDKTNAENAVAAAMINRNNAIKNCLNEITALENGQFGIDEASDANSELKMVARAQKERALKEFQKLMATRDNKHRIIKINSDFSKRYDAYTEIFRLLFFLSIPLVLLAYLNKLEMINNLVYFRGALLIIVVGVLMTFTKLMDIYSRSNMDFDKYAWNEKSVKEDSINAAKKAYNKRSGINISGISLDKDGNQHPSFYCDISNPDTTKRSCWDPSRMKCVKGPAKTAGTEKEKNYCQASATTTTTTTAPAVSNTATDVTTDHWHGSTISDPTTAVESGYDTIPLDVGTTSDSTASGAHMTGANLTGGDHNHPHPATST